MVALWHDFRPDDQSSLYAKNYDEWKRMYEQH